MEEENANKHYPGHDMLLMIPQEYKIGNNLLNDPVGVNCTQVEGNYLNILARTSVMHNTAKSFENANITIADTSIPPLVLANVLLSENERRQGCVLIDFGADTTTISVYKGGCLRFLSVIPMGGQNITRDLCSLQLDEHEAERIKREYGLTTPVADANTLILDDGRAIDLNKVHEVIEARFEEIILNVCHQIEVSGYTEKQLLSGVVCCGGGINLKGFKETAIKKPQISKMRLAHNTTTKVEWTTAERPEDGTQGVLVGLLMEGVESCCENSISTEIKPEDERRAKTLDLFTEDGESAQAKRDEEIKIQRQQKIKEAEERKREVEMEKKKAKSKNFFTGFVKKIQTLTDSFEDKIGDFLDEDNKQ
jgi:cell division protein FtsA